MQGDFCKMPTFAQTLCLLRGNLILGFDQCVFPPQHFLWNCCWSSHTCWLLGHASNSVVWLWNCPTSAAKELCSHMSFTISDPLRTLLLYILKWMNLKDLMHFEEVMPISLGIYWNPWPGNLHAFGGLFQSSGDAFEPWRGDWPFFSPVFLSSSLLGL